MTNRTPTNKHRESPAAKESLATYQTPVRRREALKALGALVVTVPSVAAISCASDSHGSSTDAGASAGAPPTATSTAGTSAQTTASATTTAGTSAAATPAAPTHTTTAPQATTAPATAGSNAAGQHASAPIAGTGGTTPPAAGSGGSAAPSDFIPVTFDDVASCTLTPTDPAGEGPFFIHEEEVMDDEDLIRSDMREGKPGVELQLNLRVLDSDGTCMKPISGVEVYTWHTDATGFYSGFANQNPDQSYMGSIERTVENMDRFCRGIQVTGADGIVRFKTIYPGWYNGRAIHIHFVALHPGSKADTSSYRSTKYMLFTTQMYFAESFSRMIHENNDPYIARATGAAYNMYVKPQNMTVNPSARMEGKIAVAALNIITSATGSRR